VVQSGYHMATNASLVAGISEQRRLLCLNHEIIAPRLRVTDPPGHPLEWIGGATSAGLLSRDPKIMYVRKTLRNFRATLRAMEWIRHKPVHMQKPNRPRPECSRPLPQLTSRSNHQTTKPPNHRTMRPRTGGLALGDRDMVLWFL
jgi:hypothetical protein